MLKYLVQCEICTNSFPFNPMEPNVIPPPSWLILFQGELAFADGKHFCSKECLRTWVLPTLANEHVTTKGKGR